MPQDDEKNDA